MDKPILIEHLSHRFNGHYALQDTSYEVREGEVFALLGPNGAGKTTTIRLLNGLYTPTSGTIRVFGRNPVTEGGQVRKEAGVLTETSALYERLSARENLLFFGRLYGLTESFLLKRTDEILEFFALNERANDRVSTFSKGMKQRLALARAFLSQPRILYLDEPTASLDPESALQVHELIESLSRSGDCTVFLCTHHLPEAERLADRVAILNKGRLLSIGSLDELRQQYAPGVWVEIELLQPAPIEWKDFPGVVKVEMDDRVARVQVTDDHVIPDLISGLVHLNAQIVRVNPQRTTLEDIYFKLQAEAREGQK